MSADIIQFIPRPTPHREATDFPAIAFRSALPGEPTKDVAEDRVAGGNVSRPPFARRDLVADHADTAASEYVPTDWSEK